MHFGGILGGILDISSKTRFLHSLANLRDTPYLRATLYLRATPYLL